MLVYIYQIKAVLGNKKSGDPALQHQQVTVIICNLSHVGPDQHTKSRLPFFFFYKVIYIVDKL